MTFSLYRVFTTFSSCVSSKIQHSQKTNKIKLVPQHVPRRRQWHPTPVLLPGKSHGQRSLVGCSPWGRYESDTTERLPFHFSLSQVGEGNGNPLQCSCLENPRDGGVWWASVYAVAQSWTQLKWLSSNMYPTHVTEFLDESNIQVKVVNWKC